MKKAQKLTVLICMALICAFVEIPLLAQTPTLHAPNELNDTSDYWGAGSVPNVYRFKTDSVVVVNYHSTPDEGYDWSANVFPALALHGSGSPFHSALLLGNNGKIQLRRTFNSSIGLELSTYWTNETGNLNDQGGYISFRPRSVEKDSTGDYRPGPEAMRIVPGGLIGIGTTSPTEQFHTTKGVRFEGITSNESLSSFLVRDDAGKLFYRDIDFNQFLTFSCTSPSVVPLFDDNGTANLVCSIIKQGKTEGCNGWAHQSVGINGDPVGVGYSGSFGECHNVYLTVHGSALAAGGLWIASDKRIKKDFESVSPELGVEKLRKLNPVRFTYDAQAAQSMGVNGITDHLSSGFVAQEVADVIPEAVSITESGLNILNPDVLIPYLTAALQYQDEQIERLNERISLLEEKIAALYGVFDLDDGKSFEGESQYHLKLSPNPAEKGTEIVIDYQLPDLITDGSLYALKIYSVSGNLLKELPVLQDSGRLHFTCDSSSNELVVILFKGEVPVISRKLIVVQ